MFKFSALSLLSLMFLTSASQSAIIVSGDLSIDDQEIVDTILRTYIGPSPKYLENTSEESEIPEVKSILLNKDIPFAEVEFLRDYFAKAKLNVEVAYVPTTIWNLHAINFHLTDNSMNGYSKLIEAARPEKPKFDKFFRNRYFLLSKRLMNTLKSREVIDTKYFIDLSIHYLMNIDQNKTTDNEWSRAMTKELEKINNNTPSILHKMIEEEMEAGKNNDILFVRATGGIRFKSAEGTTTIKRQEQNFRLDFEKEKGVKPSDQEVANFLEKGDWIRDWYQDPSDEKILDFPLKGKSVCEGIQDFQDKISEKKAEEGYGMKDLSYADSLLAGYLYDGFNRTGGACTFVWLCQVPNNTLYTLHLSKDWLFSKGHSLFHMPSLETDGIFGSQEIFHPRLRAMESSTTLVLKNEMTYYTTPSNLFHIESYAPYENASELTDDRKDAIKGFEYALEANRVISQARVISFEGQILDRQNYPAAVINLLERQKEASVILKEKMEGRL